MQIVKTLVLRTAGSNCDYETVHAFQMAGSQVELVHINRLLSGQVRLCDFHILAIPGGFTYGDDISAGKILANELKYKLGADLHQFHQDGKIMLGICNGFQVMVKAGLLPEMDLQASARITLTHNDSGKFEDRWVYLQVTRNHCIFTQNMPERVYFPVAHAEGKFIAESKEILEQMEQSGQIVFQYIEPGKSEPGYPWNPNGSVRHIAGICDSTGRILGLMPHPERHLVPIQHPHWTRLGLQPEGDGLLIFQNAINYVKEKF